MDIFAACQVSARTARQLLQQRSLSGRRSLLRLPLHTERRWMWCAEEMAQCLLIVRVPVLRAMFWWPYSCQRLRGDRTSPACIRCQHRGPASCVMVWTALGYTTHTFLVRIDGNLTADRYFLTSCVQCYYPILEAYQTKSFKKIIQGHMLHVVFWPISVHGEFNCCLGLHGLQISHPLKISGHGSLRDKPTIPLIKIIFFKKPKNADIIHFLNY